MCINAEAEEIHVPKTRQGGSFAHPSAVKLHANDFSLEDKAKELTYDEKEHVQQYLNTWETCLASKTRAPRDSCAAPKPWESHYSSSRHSFPLKNYIIHAFPVLDDILSGTVQKPAIIECGCGTGSTLLPLMKYSAPDDALFVGFDVSATSIKYFSEHDVAQQFKNERRLHLLVFDAVDDSPGSGCSHESDEEAATKRARHECADKSLANKLGSEYPALKDVKYDAVLLIFVLSAMTTAEDMRVAIRQLHNVMKPEGVLLFRDYALPDHNFFRFLTRANGEMKSPIAFSKGDGTSQVFFEKDVVARLFGECGFAMEKMEYHCNRIVNRKNGKRMDKIFLNGTFRLKKE